MSVISLAVRSCLPESLNHTLTLQLMVIASWRGALVTSCSASYVLLVFFKTYFLLQNSYMLKGSIKKVQNFKPKLKNKERACDVFWFLNLENLCKLCLICFPGNIKSILMENNLPQKEWTINQF